MIPLIVVLSFIGAIVSVPTAIALIKGLKFQIKDFNCPKEVKSVKLNINSIKVITIINAILFIALVAIAGSL